VRVIQSKENNKGTKGGDGSRKGGGDGEEFRRASGARVRGIETRHALKY
jgi:hypothetical protein